MLHAGILPDEICRCLDLNKKSLNQHIMRIQGISDMWLDYIATSGYMIAYQKGLTDILSNRKRLNGILARIDKKLKKNSLDIKVGYLEVQTLAQMDKNIELHLKLLGSAPLAASFRKFIKENIIERKSHRNNSNNRYGLPVLPEELENDSNPKK